MVNRLAQVFLVVALALASLGFWCTRATHEPAVGGPNLVVSCATPVLGELPIGTHEIVIQVANRGGNACRVLGAPAECGAKVCYKSKASESVQVAPGATINYPLQLTVNSTGPFELPLTIFVDDGGLRTVEAIVRGVGVARKGTTDGLSSK